MNDPSIMAEPVVDQETKTISLNLATVDSLTPYEQEYFIPEIKEGEDIHVGQDWVLGKLYLKADFSNFEEKLSYVNAQELESQFEKVGKLEKELPHLDEDTRRFIHTCWRAARITRHLLGEPSSETLRNNSFEKYHAKDENGVKICVKPLSETVNQAVCAEYCLLSHYILKKLGIESSIVVGAFSEESENPTFFMHTYLVLNKGEYVFDPTHTASQKGSWPPKIFRTEFFLTADSLKNMETDPEKPFGKKAFCTNILTKEKKVYGSGA